MANRATSTGVASDSPLSRQARETAGITSALLLGYVERVGGTDAVAEVLGRCGLEGCEAELRDENCWFSWQTKIDLFQATGDVLGRAEFLDEMASFALDLNVAGALKVGLRTLGSPQLVYRSIVRANSRFVSTHAMELLDLSSGWARVRFFDLAGAGRYHPLDCHYTGAMLCVVPELFGLPRADLAHVQCACDGADGCIYELRWHEHVATGRRAVAAGFTSMAALVSSAVWLPSALPEAIAVAVASTGMLALSELRRHRKAWTALRREAEDNADVAQRLFASLQDLTSELRLEEVLSKVTHHAQAAIGGREFALLVREGDGFMCQRSSGLPPATVAALEAWSNGAPRVTEHCVTVDDVATVPELSTLPDGPLPLHSLASAPLSFYGEAFGLLIALGSQSYNFLPRDVEVLLSFATQVSIALHNARRYHVTKTQADCDALTGLLNHRSFHEAVEQAIEAADRQAACVVLVDLDNFKRVNDEDGHSAGDRLLRAAARALSDVCRPDDLAFRIGGDEFALLLTDVDEAAAAGVAEQLCGAIGALDSRLGASAGVAALESSLSKSHVLEQADRLLYAAKRGEVPPERRSASSSGAARVAVDVLSAALAMHHEPTATHSHHAAELAERVAVRLGIAQAECERVYHAALLHDLGKLTLPGEVLEKPSRLTAIEWNVMRAHPQEGAGLLRRVPGLGALADAVGAAQERWDGTGYPARLTGDEIPLIARIVAVCDAYDAMTRARPYRDARTPDAALSELQACAGTQFDPEVVEALSDELATVHATGELA